MIKGLDEWLTREPEYENDNLTRFHCLFEQSGTFKNVFKSYGHEAYDYDIANEYGQTDYEVDLFEQIELKYDSLVTGGGY